MNGYVESRLLTDFRMNPGTDGILIRPVDGESATLIKTSQWELEDMYKYVGRPIEVARIGSGHFRGFILIVNENGKLEDMPYNRTATRIASFNNDDYVAGAALLVPPGTII